MLKKALSILRHSPVSKLMGGTILGQIIGMVLTPLVTYFYLPSEYGVFSLFLVFITWGNSIVTLRLGELFMNEDDKDIQAINVKSFIVLIPIVSFALTVSYFLLSFFNLFGYSHSDIGYTPFIYLALLSVGSYNYLKYLNLKGKRYSKISVLEIYKQGGKGTVQLSLGILGSGAFGLIVGELVGRSLGIYNLLKSELSLFKLSLKVSLSKVWKYLRSNISFISFGTSSSFLSTLSISLPIPIVVSLYGDSIAGQYSLVYKVLSVPIILIGKSFADYFHEKAANNKARITRLFNNQSRIMFLFASLVFVPAFFLSEYLFTVFLGSEWQEAGRIAKVLIPWFYFLLTVNSLSRVLFVLERQKLKFLYDFISIGLVVAVYFVSMYMRLDWIDFFIYLSVAKSISYVFYYFLIRYAVKQYQIDNI